MQYFIFHTVGPTDLLHLSPAPHFRTSQIFLVYCRVTRSGEHWRGPRFSWWSQEIFYWT